MNRRTAIIAVFAFSFSTSTKPLPDSSALIFEGNITAADGSPIPGAEVQLLDAAG